MFLIDDVLLRPLGLSVQPFDMIWYLELMRNLALKEKYNTTKISNSIKENRLLLEIGQIREEEYRKKHEELLEQLEKAKEVMQDLPKDIKIREL